MDGIGPITNTRTIDDAIGEALAQLSKAPQTKRVAHLLAEVRRYQRVVSSWAHEPPEPEVQFEVIGELMSLLNTAMTVADEPELEVTDVDAPRLRMGPDGPTSEPAPKRAARKSKDGKLPDLQLDVPAARPDAPAAVGDPLEGVLPTSKGAALPPVGGEDSDGIDDGVRLVRSDREPWRAVARNAGIQMRIIGVRPSGESRHVMLRLDKGAELPSHRHGTPEVVLVLDGCIEVGHDLLHAGGFLLSRPGEIGLPIRSVGESTLVVYDTDRRFGER